MMKISRRHLALGAAALATAAAMVAVRDEPADEPLRVASIAAPEPARATRTAPDPADDLDLDALRRPEKHATIPDLFAPETAPATARPPRMGGTATDGAAAGPVEPAAPAAPPFTYLGRVVDGRGTAVFLALGERSLAVEAGQDVDGDYRLEAIGPDSLTVLHRPSGQRQRLPIPPRS
jgi:hypothetical protein